MGGSWERKAPRNHSDFSTGLVRGRKLRRWPTACCFSILPVGTARHSRTNSLAGELDGDILGTSEESEGTTLGENEVASDGTIELDGDLLGTSLGIEEKEGVEVTPLGSIETDGSCGTTAGQVSASGGTVSTCQAGSTYQQYNNKSAMNY